MYGKCICMINRHSMLQIYKSHPVNLERILREEMAAAGGSLDLDENFYGDQDFDMEDFDKEGFGGLDEAGNSFEEEKY